MSACEVTLKDGDKTSKGRQDVFCIYCGGEWPNKQWLSKYQHKGCNKAPFYPNAGKHVQLLMYPNLKFAQETKKLKTCSLMRNQLFTCGWKARQKSMKSKIKNLYLI
jgi:hypothetical protein